MHNAQALERPNGLSGGPVKAAQPMWGGDYGFLIRSLILKDFRIRYRHMSLGVFWSLLNPLVMVAVFTLVFSRVFASSVPNYPVFLLCGIIAYNFFVMVCLTGTNSLVENAALIKHVPVRREVIPITSVLSNTLHLLIQLGLLLGLTLAFGLPVTVHWLWLPLVWALALVFLCGLVLITSSLNVYVRDVRYVVEAVTLPLLFLSPVFYSFDIIPPEYREIYQYNPLSALIMATRFVLLEAKAPPAALLGKLALVSAVTLALGLATFRSLRRRFFDYL